MAKPPQKKPGLLRSIVVSLRAVPPLQRTIVIVGVCIASVFELVGFAATIPLLSVISPESDMAIGGRREMIHNALENAYATLGLPTVLAVTHGGAWRQMADRIYKISGGAIMPVEPGAPAEVVPISKATPALSA